MVKRYTGYTWQPCHDRQTGDSSHERLEGSDRPWQTLARVSSLVQAQTAIPVQYPQHVAAHAGGWPAVELCRQPAGDCWLGPITNGRLASNMTSARLRAPCSTSESRRSTRAGASWLTRAFSVDTRSRGPGAGGGGRLSCPVSLALIRFLAISFAA